MDSARLSEIIEIFSDNQKDLTKSLILQLNTDETRNNNVIIGDSNNMKCKFSLTKYHDYEVIFEYNTYDNETLGKRIVKLNEPLISNRNLNLIKEEMKFVNHKK